MSEHHGHDAELVGHEETDAEVGLLVRFAIFLAVFTAIIAVLMIGFYRYLDGRERAEKAPRYPLAAGVERPLPPTPRLQSYPFDDVKGLRREEAMLLDHYAWIDKNAGTVRIPVSRAIELLAERGLPHRGEPGTPAAPAAEAPAPPAPAPVH